MLGVRGGRLGVTVTEIGEQLAQEIRIALGDRQAGVDEGGGRAREPHVDQQVDRVARQGRWPQHLRHVGRPKLSQQILRSAGLG